jgi:hypothetical protein
MQIIRKTLRIWFVVLVLLFGNILFVPAQTYNAREYQIKAAFLFNFTQFVNWPPTAFVSDQSPLIIGILGKDPFGSYLDETVVGEKINGRSLIIQRYKSIEEVDRCHILFINLPDAKKFNDVITNLKGRNVLTVGDDPDFLQRGGMMKFFTKDNKVQIQVNLEATQAANLTVSSKLLRLVQIFTPSKNM